jgi:hypothetical protein
MRTQFDSYCQYCYCLVNRIQHQLYALPNKLKEVSGIAYSTQSSLLWFLKIAVMQIQFMD